MSNLTKSIISLATIISFCFGVYFFVDKTYARDEKVILLEKRLDYKIQTDVLSNDQSRLWKLEDRFGSDCDKVTDPVIKQEMKELKEKINQQKQKLNNFK
jgi:hypothetical protein